MIYDPQSQRDPRWANVKLGAGAPTIGAAGCFITVYAMMLSHYFGATWGKQVTPLDVNGQLLKLGGYVNGNEVTDDDLAKLGPGLQSQVWDYVGRDADLSKLQMADDEERLVVVDFDHNPGDGIQTHALRVFSWDGTTLIVDDPWYGTRDNFTKNYGPNLKLTIQKIVGYKIPGWVPPWKPAPPVVTPPVVIPPVDPRDAQIEELTRQLAAASSSLAGLQKQLADRDAKDVLRRAKAQELVALL